MEVRAGEKGKMNKDLKEVIRVLLTLASLFIGYQVWLVVKEVHWIMFFVLLLICLSLPQIIVSYIPSPKKVMRMKKKQGNKNQNKAIHTSKKNNSKRGKSKKELFTAEIDSLIGDDFEELVYLYFKDKGFNPTRTGKSGDHGVDLVIKDPKDGLQIAVQCKRYNKEYKIGNADIIKLQGGKRFYKCPGALFITTSYFTDKAKEFADECNIQRWDRSAVDLYINKWRKAKLKRIS